MIRPESKYVDDGYRDMGMAEEGVREDFTNHLYNYFIQEGKEDLVTWIDSDTDQDSTIFYNNYKNILTRIMNNKNKAFEL